MITGSSITRAAGGSDRSGCGLKSADDDNFQAPNPNRRLSICGLADGSGGPADRNRSTGLRHE